MLGTCVSKTRYGMRLQETVGLNLFHAFYTGNTGFRRSIALPLEGFNNKIKTLKRRAYGYRNQEYFKLKILALHRSQYALVG